MKNWGEGKKWTDRDREEKIEEDETERAIEMSEKKEKKSRE